MAVFIVKTIRPAAFVTTLAVGLIPYGASADQCYFSGVLGGIEAQGDAKAALYDIEFINKHRSRSESVRMSKIECNSWMIEDIEKRVCSDSSTVERACDQSVDKQQEPTSARIFAENTVRAGLTLLIIGTGFDPTNIFAAVLVDQATVKVLDAYDRDRGDVKKFAEKIGQELSEEKFNEWVNNPAESFGRSDLGRASQGLADSVNRSDVGKVLNQLGGIKF